MNDFQWLAPRDTTEAMTAASITVASAMVTQGSAPRNEGIVFKAGGIDLLDLMKERLLTPTAVVNLRELPGLGAIAETESGVRIGANVTLTALANHPLIRTRYRALADAAGVSASPQIRNVATIAGNLLQRPRCWYFRSTAHHCARKGGYTCFAFAGENQYHAVFNHNGCAIVHPSTSATALVAFGAELEIAGRAGATRTVRLEDFLLLPEIDIHHENDLKAGELVTAIVLPRPPASTRSYHLKQGETDSFDWPIADVAVVLDRATDSVCTSASIVLGAASPVPHRARAAEAVLIGKPIDEAAAAAAAKAALRGAQPLTKNAYKLPVLETLVQRAVLAAARQA